MRTVGHVALSRLAPLGAAAALILGVAGTAQAATAPSALTGPVTAVASTTATLSGTLNPNGTATPRDLPYGTSTPHGTKPPAGNGGAGTANTGVSSNLTSLTGGTTYHYRLVATSTAGTTNGSDGIFTTQSATPPAVTTS